MSAVYNEIEPYAAQWLRNLIAAGHIVDGRVEERSVEVLAGDDLRDATQAHFFAGIGVWSYALRLAGWPDDLPVWTGSCPCQPFSNLGEREGIDDERHLWPAWFKLIKERRPAIVFGEQVEAAIRLGWLDAVQADLEGIDYAFAAVTFPAAGIGAPHGRHRTYFVADASGSGCSRGPRSAPKGRRQLRELESVPGGEAGELGNTERSRLERLAGHGNRIDRPRRLKAAEARSIAETGATRGFWRDAEWLWCHDRKYRPVEPGTFPLAHGATARVGRLRAYGNALVAQQAAAFIRAAADSIGLDLQTVTRR